ncbi:urate oxidase [Emydomyces testavorans]|uniref:Uricase n=1 Tax=Emydomyces testavorans TaxID=2070801 RepID=A0AAF0IJQ3_9EURO|nr:urate oxidase [Emydomyces testavorans]
MDTKLAVARYGKQNVKVCKVHRDAESGTQTVVEMTLCLLLEGDIETSYTEADNSVVVATDTMKNTIYILAKQNPVSPPELFASIVGTHFVETYKHLHAAHVQVVAHRWGRMTVDGKPHPHSFLRDGTDVRAADVDVVEGKGIEVKSSISGLPLLKSTGSQFHSFIRDEYTTLPETWDRILSTDVDANWTWAPFKNLDQVKSNVSNFDAAFASAREITLRLFAQDSSASVQNTMYKMAKEILSTEPLLNTVSYSLPNKHYLELGKFCDRNLMAHFDFRYTNSFLIKI